MACFICALKSGSSLIIIPYIDSIFDEPTVLIYTYSIYRNIENITPESLKLKLTFKFKTVESYLGFLTFEYTEFFFTDESKEELPGNEVEEIIGHAKRIRKSYQML